MAVEDRISAGSLWRQGSQEAVELDVGSDTDGDAESLASASEPGSFDDESLLGTKLTTSFGQGCIEEIHQFEDRLYCIIRLNSFGTLSLPQDAVEALLRKERKYAPHQGATSSKSNGRLQNLRGTIRMYNPAKGWGFIVCDEHEGDIFLHSKHMVSNMPREYIGHFQSSQGGHQVRFDLDLLHRHRPQALNVRVVGVAEQELPVYPKSRKARQKAEKSTTTATADEDIDFEDWDDPVDMVAAADADFHDRGDGGAMLAADTGDTAADLADIADIAAPEPSHDSAGAPWHQCAAIAGGDMSLTVGRTVVHLVDKRKGVLKMRGLPFTVTPLDIAQFFDGYGVRSEDVFLGTRNDGSNNGEACVLFARDELAEKARKERHMHHLGHRYIELFNGKGPPVEGEALPTSSAPAPVYTANREYGYAADNAGQPPVANPPAYPPIATGTVTAAPIQPPSNPVSAGAVPPTPGAAAAASQYAAFAAAVHSSTQGLQNHRHAEQALAMHAAAPGLPLGQDGVPGSQGMPQVDNAEQAAAAKQQAQVAYDHYFQYFQQAYAAALASREVQAYAAAAAAQQLQQSPQQASPGLEAPNEHLEQRSLPADYAAVQPTGFVPPLPTPAVAAATAAPAAALATASGTAPVAATSDEVAAAAATAIAVDANVEAMARDPSLFSSSYSSHSFGNAAAGGAPGLDFAMGAPGLDEVYVAQPRWQHYHEI